jgi:hypothetical protein
MTPRYQAVLLMVFVVGVLVFFRAGLHAAREVFGRLALAWCALLAFVGSLYVLLSEHFAPIAKVAIVLLVFAISLEWKIRRRRSTF